MTLMKDILHLVNPPVQIKCSNYIFLVSRQKFHVSTASLFILCARACAYAMYIRVKLYCGHLIVLWLFHLGISWNLFVLICTVVVLYCFVMCVCVCVYVYACVSLCGFCNLCLCGCFGNMYTVPWLRFFLTWGFSYPDWGFFMLFPQL
jgi:hypothetical protein